MKILYIYIFTFLFWMLQTEASEQFCSVYHNTIDTSTFYCVDTKLQTMFDHTVERIHENATQRDLEDDNVQFVTPDEFVVRSLSLDINSFILNSMPKTCEEQIYYRPKQFNNLANNHAVIKNLRALTDSLHKAGVCELPLPGNVPNVGVKNKDDLLRHFLCISNSESVFGTRNIGMGGRGPWGIHPMHNQKAGTRAFTDGKNVTLKKNGLCYPSKAIVRNQNGVEIKESDRYINSEVQLDNAKCALKLYLQKDGKSGIRGFKDWGTSAAWGSNRHCTQALRESLNFGKFLGAASCCTQACKDKYSQTTGL